MSKSTIKKKEVEQTTTVDPVVAAYTPSTEVKIVDPIKRMRKGTPISHETNFKYGDSYEKLRLPIVAVNGRTRYKNPFRSEAEKKWIEDQLGVDLNFYNMEDSYFNDFVVKLGKYAVPFDQSNPDELLALRVLEQNTDFVCIHPEERLNKITYKWIISDEGFHEIEREEIGDRKVELWSYYNNIKDDKNALISFLRLRGEMPPSNSSIKWLRAQVVEELESNPTECYIMITDKDKEWKILLDRALESRAITYDDNKEGYSIYGETHPIANNKANLILYFKNPINSDQVAKIKARIKEFADKYKN